VVRTACPLGCWDTCALLVEVSGGEVRGIRGDPDHPVTRGRLCPKARFQLDRHRSPARLKTPLIRSGAELRVSSWPAALDLVAGRMLEARDSHGSLSILHYWDTGSTGLLKSLYGRLCNLFGGVTEPHGSLCWSAGLAAQEADFGRVLAHAPEDLAHAGGVIVWGRNPADTNLHFMPFLHAAHDRGATVVVIDPLKTATVRELAARHVAPRPGTDAVLALALGAELIRRGEFDRDFCRRRAGGFEAFVSAVAGLSLAAAAAECGIPEGDVLDLADLLAFRGPGRPPVAFVLGYGLQRHAWGGDAVRAIDALAALAGSLGRPGGGSSYANRHAEGVLRDLGRPEAARAHRYFERARFGRQVAELLESGPDGGEHPISMVLCHGANPVAQLPDTGRVVDTFRRVPFKVVAELRPTDTTALADVVLPVADFLEDEDLYFCAWHAYFTWGVPAVTPPGEVWPEVQIVTELARRLGLGDAFRRPPAEWIGHALAPLLTRRPDLAPGGEPLHLRGRTFANPEAPAVPWREGPFATASGLFEFGRNWKCLEAWGTREDLGERFHLITPQHRFSLHSQFYGETLKKTSRRTGLPAVFVNPRAAGRLHLDDGRAVRVKTAQGELLAHLVFDAGLREDTACIYSGGDAGLVANGRPASANLLIADLLTDIGVQAAFYDCLCVIEPAE